MILRSVSDGFEIRTVTVNRYRELSLVLKICVFASWPRVSVNNSLDNSSIGLLARNWTKG